MGIFALAKNGEGRSARSGGWKCGHYPRPLMVGRVAHLLCYPRDLAAEGVGFKTEFDIVLLILILGGALGQCDCCMCDSSQLFRQGTKIHGNTNTRSFCTTKIIKKQGNNDEKKNQPVCSKFQAKKKNQPVCSKFQALPSPWPHTTTTPAALHRPAGLFVYALPLDATQVAKQIVFKFAGPKEMPTFGFPQDTIIN